MTQISHQTYTKCKMYVVLHCTLTAKSLLAIVSFVPILTVTLHLYIPECLLITLLILMLLPVVYGALTNLPFPFVALKSHAIEHAGLQSAVQEYGPNDEPSVTLTVFLVGVIIAANGPSVFKIQYIKH